MDPFGVVGAAVVDEDPPRPVRRAPHGVAAPVMVLPDGAGHGPPGAVPAGRAGRRALLVADAGGGVEKRVWHPSGQRRPLRGKRAAEARSREAGGQVDGGAADGAARPSRLEPVKPGEAALAAVFREQVGRGLDRAVVAPDPLELRRGEIDEKRVVAVARLEAAERPRLEPAGRGGRDDAGPGRGRCRVGQDVGLEAPVGGGDRPGVGQRLDLVDAGPGAGGLRQGRGGGQGEERRGAPPAPSGGRGSGHRRASWQAFRTGNAASPPARRGAPRGASRRPGGARRG